MSGSWQSAGPNCWWLPPREQRTPDLCRARLPQPTPAPHVAGPRAAACVGSGRGERVRTRADQLRRPVSEHCHPGPASAALARATGQEQATVQLSTVSLSILAILKSAPVVIAPSNLVPRRSARAIARLTVALVRMSRRRLAPRSSPLQARGTKSMPSRVAPEKSASRSEPFFSQPALLVPQNAPVLLQPTGPQPGKRLSRRCRSWPHGSRRLAGEPA